MPEDDESQDAPLQKLYAFGFNLFMQCGEAEDGGGINLLKQVHKKEDVLLGIGATWALSYAWDSSGRIHLWGCLESMFEGCNNKYICVDLSGIDGKKDEKKKAVISRFVITELDQFRSPDHCYAIYVLICRRKIWRLKTRCWSSSKAVGARIDYKELFTPSCITIKSDVEEIRKIAVTREWCVALMENGSMYKIRNLGPSDPELVTSPSMTDIGAGRDHFLSIDCSGSVYSWNSHNMRGELGLGEGNVQLHDEPVYLSSMGGLQSVKVSAGAQHSLVLTKSGDIYGFGSNAHGQIGVPHDQGQEYTDDLHTTRCYYLEATLVEDLDFQQCSKVLLECGAYHSLCATPSKLISTGWNKYRQVLPLTQDPTMSDDNRWRDVDLSYILDGKYKITLIAAGQWHSLVCVGI